MRARSPLRLLVGSAIVGLALGAILTCAGIGVGVWLGTPAGQSWLVGTLEQLGTRATTGGQVEIGAARITANGVVLDGVVLSQGDRRLASVDHLAAGIEWSALLRRRLHVRELRGDGLYVDLGADADGVFDLTRLFGGPSAPSADDEPFRLPLALALDDVDLRGIEIRYYTPSGTIAHATDLDVRAQIEGAGDHVDVKRLSLVGALVEPAAAGVRAAGGLWWDGTDGIGLDDLRVEIPGSGDLPLAALVASGQWGDAARLAVTLERADLGGLDDLLGDAGLGGVWSGALAVSGPAERLDVTVDLAGEDGAGEIHAQGHVEPQAAPIRWDLAATLAAVDVRGLYTPLTEPVVLDGELALRGRGTSLASDLTLDGTWSGGPQVLYGYDVDQVAAQFSVAGGVLHLDHSLLDGILGPITIDGDVGLEEGPLTVRISGPLDPARLAALGAEGVGGDGVVDAVVRTDLRAEDAPIHIDGTVTFAPFTYPNVRAARLAAPFDLTVHGGTVRGTIALDGDDLDLSGLRAERLRTAPLALTVERGVTTLHGPEATLAGIVYPDTLTAGQASGPIAVRVDPKHTSFTAELAVVDPTLLDFPGSHGTLRLGLVDDALSYDVDLRAGARPLLVAVGRYDLASAQVVLDELAFAPTPRTTWTAQRPVRLIVVDGGIADADLSLASPLGEIEILGRLARAGPLDAAVSVRGLQIDHVAELFPAAVPALGGTFTGSAQVSGDAADPHVDADLDIRGLNVEGTVRSMDLAGTLRLADGHLEPALAIGAAHAPLARLTGDLPVRGGLAAPDLDWDADASLDLAILPGGTERLHDLTSLLDDVELPAGRASGVVTARGPLRDPVLRAAGVSELDVAGWDKPGRIELSVTRRGDELAVTADLRQDLYSRARIDATAATRMGEVFAALAAGRDLPDTSDPRLVADDVHATLDLHDLPAASVGALAGVDATLGGTLAGSWLVRGSPLAPVATGSLRWDGAYVGRQPLEGAFFSLEPRADGDEGYDVVLRVSDPAGAFAARGVVPVRVDLLREPAEWVTGEMAIDLSGDVPLGLLEGWSTDVRAAEGRLAIAGHVGGTPFAPVADLTAQIDGGRVAYRALGVDARDIDLAARITDRTLTLERADVVLLPFRERTLEGVVTEATSVVSEAAERVDGGERPRVSARGTAILGEDGGITLDGALHLEDGPWLIATEDTTLRANGALTIVGAWPALRVRGNLAVIQGHAEIDTAELAGAAPLTVDPSLTVVRVADAAGAAVATPRPVEPPAYAAFDVDVRLDLQRNIELAMSVPVFDQFGRIGADLTSTDITARLGGALSLQLERGEPTLVGAVELLDGQLRMLRSTFQLESGRITFAGGDPYEDADLDIAAVMNVPTGGQVHLKLTGTAAHPDPPALSSEEYPDTDQQMAILLTGQAPEELTSAEGAGAAQILATIGQTVVASVLGGRSLGTLSFDPDGAVRVSVPLTPTLHAATVYAPLSTDLEANSIALEAEWSILPRLVLSGALGDRTSHGDVFWEIRF